MTPQDIITDEEVHRFIDGELSEERRTDVQARLARDPQRAAEVFAEADRMTALRAPHARQMFATKANVDAAARLKRTFGRRWLISALRLPVAAGLVFAVGGVLGWTVRPLPSQTVDGDFVLAAREALRVAQLDAGPNQNVEHKQEKIERLGGRNQYQRAAVAFNLEGNRRSGATLAGQTKPCCDGDHANAWPSHAGCGANERGRGRAPHARNRWACSHRLLADGRNCLRAHGTSAI